MLRLIGFQGKIWDPTQLPFVWDEEGELVLAKGEMIQETTSLVVEVITVWKYLSYCYNN